MMLLDGYCDVPAGNCAQISGMTTKSFARVTTTAPSGLLAVASNIGSY